MKIAFISYEYPPDTANGGIATYIYQIATILCRRGHHVEVFAATTHSSNTQTENGIVVHRIQGQNDATFARQIGEVFANRHRIVRFDVLEGPEIHACARGALEYVPEIPLVVKLHTPTFLVGMMNSIEPSFVMKVRRVVGALRRGQKPSPFPGWVYNPLQDIEYLHTLDADEITTPSNELGIKLIDAWRLPEQQVVQLPNPYDPVPELLEIPAATHTNIVTFIGRLEVRKGILELAQAIPLILQQCPAVRFRFVGAAHPSPQLGIDMQKYLEKRLRRYRKSLEFLGAIALSKIPSVLATTDICVFPSRWENFPNVCLEAMAAARGVIGSSAGGMVEMLDHGLAGRLVSPNNPESIAQCVIELVRDPELRIHLGKKARDRILSEYNQERIGKLQEESYRRAIARRKILGSRIVTSHSVSAR